MAIELVLMTILGCDDGGTSCRYIATVNQRWETVSLCNAVSEKRLLDYRDQPYPVVVAVCQTPDPKVVTDLAVKPLIKKDGEGSRETHTGPQAPAPAVTAQEEGLADRAISRVSEALPSAKGLKNIFRKPVRLVENGYSWVARRVN